MLNTCSKNFTERDEVKFAKFISRLRDNFVNLFLDTLRVQLSLVGVMSIEDFDAIKAKIRFKYHSDSHYSELKNIELLRERLSVAAGMEPYIGRFGLSEESESRNMAEIQNELKTGEIAPPEEPPEEEK